VWQWQSWEEEKKKKEEETVTGGIEALTGGRREKNEKEMEAGEAVTVEAVTSQQHLWHSEHFRPVKEKKRKVE
jgi:hypothetical protein